MCVRRVGISKLSQHVLRLSESGYKELGHYASLRPSPEWKLINRQNSTYTSTMLVNGSSKIKLLDTPVDVSNIVRAEYMLPLAS